MFLDLIKCKDSLNITASHVYILQPDHRNGSMIFKKALDIWRFESLICNINCTIRNVSWKITSIHVRYTVLIMSLLSEHSEIQHTARPHPKIFHNTTKDFFRGKTTKVVMYRVCLQPSRFCIKLRVWFEVNFNSSPQMAWLYLRSIKKGRGHVI